MLKNVSSLFIYFFNFTLYPACNRVGRGSLMLRHSAPHFPANSGGFAYSEAELNVFATTPERRNENIKSVPGLQF